MEAECSIDDSRSARPICYEDLHSRRVKVEDGRDCYMRSLAYPTLHSTYHRQSVVIVNGVD